LDRTSGQNYVAYLDSALGARFGRYMKISSRFSDAWFAFWGHVRYPPINGRLGHANVVIMTILDEEFGAVRDVLNLRRPIQGSQYFGAEPVEGNIWDTVVFRCLDRSNVPASNAIRDAMEDLRPRFILLVGIAGGLCDDGVPRDDVQLGDVVIPEHVDYGEFLKMTDDGPLLRHYAFDHPSLHLRKNVSVPLTLSFDLKKAVTMNPPKEYKLGSGFKIHSGSILSFEKIMSASDENPVQKELLKSFDKALALDMESIGVARGVCEGRTSFWYNPRYAIIRGISDYVGASENNEVRRLWKQYAAHGAAVVAKEFIRLLPAD